MNALQKEIVARVRASGPLPFAAYMQIALYDSDHGYYSGGARRTGWRGDFVTSPELDPCFGALWARGFQDIWRACGTPDRFEIVEIGPGEGTFAAAVLDAVDDDFGAALTYRLVERIPALRDRQQQRLRGHPRVEWTESVTELPELGAACVFANEVLDNLPVHLVEMHGGELVEMCVGQEDDELVFVARPPSNPELGAFLERNGMVLSDGERAEVTLAAESLISRVTGRLRLGAVVFVDYGMSAADISARGGTVVAYSAGGADADVLVSPGEKDITAHANWTSTADAMRRSQMSVRGPLLQREVLLALGARAIEDSFKAAYEHAISEGRGADALASLSRRQALGALLDPGGLGGLQVVAGLTGMDAPAFLA